MFFNFKKNQVWAESSHIVMQIGLTMAGCIVFCFFVGASSRRRQKIKKQTWTSGRLSVVFGGSNPENRFLEFGSAACGGTLRRGLYSDPPIEQ